VVGCNVAAAARAVGVEVAGRAVGVEVAGGIRVMVAAAAEGADELPAASTATTM
jgi:hypothetical protein